MLGVKWVGMIAVHLPSQICLGNFSKNDYDSLNIRGYYDQDNFGWDPIWSASRQVYLPNLT